MKTKGNRLYGIWTKMRYRCSKPYRPEYPRYGGRGISVCKEWNNLENGFSNFVSWAMSNGYSDELTLDRINNDGDYEPNNCRWADWKTQQRNRRNSRYVTYKGETLHLNTMAEKYNLPTDIVRHRYDHGWDLERIFTTPVTPVKRRRVIYQGKEMSLRELSEATGVNYSTIKTRYRKGYYDEITITEL